MKIQIISYQRLSLILESELNNDCYNITGTKFQKLKH